MTGELTHARPQTLPANEHSPVNWWAFEAGTCENCGAMTQEPNAVTICNISAYTLRRMGMKFVAFQDPLPPDIITTEDGYYCEACEDEATAPGRCPKCGAVGTMIALSDRNGETARACTACSPRIDQKEDG